MSVCKLDLIYHLYFICIMFVLFTVKKTELCKSVVRYVRNYSWVFHHLPCFVFLVVHFFFLFAVLFCSAFGDNNEDARTAVVLFQSLARRKAMQPLKQPCWYTMTRLTEELRPRSLVSWTSASGMSTPVVVQKTRWVMRDLGWPHSLMASSAASFPSLGTSTTTVLPDVRWGNHVAAMLGLAARISSGPRWCTCSVCGSWTSHLITLKKGNILLKKLLD